MSIALPVSGFSPEAVIKYAMLIVGALMLSLIWHVADLLNEGLIRVMYPNADTLLDLIVSEGASTAAWVFGIFLFTLYFLLPSIFLLLMRNAGYQMADAAKDGIGDFKEAGQKGASGVKAAKK